MNGEIFSPNGNIFVTFLASILIWVMYGGLLTLWIVDGRIKKEQALHAFISSVLAWTVTQMIKTIYPITRPYHINGKLPLTLTLAHNDGAFPSTHAALAFALAVSVWLHNKKVGSLFILLAIGVGVGRVVGNVHYFTDIVGGAVIGSLIAIAIDKVHFYKILGNKKKYN